MTCKAATQSNLCFILQMFEQKFYLWSNIKEKRKQFVEQTKSPSSSSFFGSKSCSKVCLQKMILLRLFVVSVLAPQHIA
jgi:hypothetical protein